MISPVGNIVTSYAVAQVGKPYVFNTPLDVNNSNPPTFDCSGLTMWCWNKAGTKLAHYTVTQYAQTQHRPLAQAQPGDLVFWQDTTGFIEHVAIFMGQGQVIEAPEPGKNVRWAGLYDWKPPMPNVGVFPGGQTDNIVSGVDTANAVSATSLGGITSIPSSIGKAFSWLTTLSHWERIGLMLLGALIVGIVTWNTVT